jgi:TolA-binding protein
MVEHNDDFGSSAPPPEGNLGDLNFGEPNLGSEPGEHATIPDDQGTHEAAFKHPQHAPPPGTIDERPKHPIFPMVLGAAMVVALVVAWAVNMKPVESSGTAAAAAPATSDATPAPEPSPPVAELSDGVKSLRAELDGIKGDLKTLQDRIEAMAKPAPPPDLEPLNTKIDDLAKNNKALAALPKKVDDLDHRVGALDKSLAAERDDINALKSEVKKLSDQGTAASRPESTATSTSSKPEDVNVSDSALDQGAELFKAGKYKEASDVFKKLTETNPNDARVWYFAALSRGSATNQWTGETTRMVEKGVEREKAGSPESSKIDAVFTGLNPAFKPWLDAYRKAIKR